MKNNKRKGKKAERGIKELIAKFEKGEINGFQFDKKFQELSKNL